MGRWSDFFKALATNHDVMDDEHIQAELEQFMAENADSVKRVSDFERRLKESTWAKETETQRKKPVVKEMPAKSALKKEKAEKSVQEERDER